MITVRSQPYHLDYTGDDPLLGPLFSESDEMLQLLFEDLKAVADSVDVGAEVQAYSAELDGLAALATTGVIARTAAGTYTARTLTAGAGIAITNGDGVSGNPTITATANAAVLLARIYARG